MTQLSRIAVRLNESPTYSLCFYYGNNLAVPGVFWAALLSFRLRTLTRPSAASVVPGP